jgi:hypothetical protein
MNTLYTAIGKFVRQNNNGQYCPVILVKDEEHLVDIQEMILWSSLSWRFLSMPQIKSVYEQKSREVNVSTGRSLEQCLNRMLQRGLIVSGTGDSGADALYDLLKGLYIIPVCSSFLIKVVSFLKLTFFDGLPLHVTRRIFQTEPMTVEEQRVIGLAKQALLSTAEIIKCVDQEAYDLSTNQKVLNVLYDDEYTTCDNIGSLAKYFKSQQPIILAVANLYLHKQIILERI